MFCPKCGTQNSPEVNFCKGCGAKINESNSVPQQQPVNNDIQQPYHSPMNNSVQQAVYQAPVNNVKKGNKKMFMIGGIVLGIILLILGGVFVVNFLNKSKLSVYGSWKTSGDSLFVFKKDNTFYWYKDYDKLDDNYYKGNMELLSGQEALDELGYDDEEWDRLFKETANKEDAFSLKLYPTYLLSGGEDKTDSSNITGEDYWTVMFIVKNDKVEAYGYNLNTDDVYELEKIDK